MAQNDMNIANQGFPAFRADLNAALAALVSNSSGATAPSATFPHQFWVDTAASPSVLKQRNLADDDWVTIGTIDETTGAFKVAAGSVTTDNISGLLDYTTDVVESRTGTAGGLGFRNRLINAQGLINQRGYVSGTATTTANQYTVDRWRVVVSGQNLTFSTTNNETTFTAPAGGIEQVIEGLNLESGTYVLNWEGTATATVGGTAVAKGGIVTVVGGTNTTVRFIGGTFIRPQFEAGSVATPFERRPYGTELALCQRYYIEVGIRNASGSDIFPLQRWGTSLLATSFNTPVTMRATPTGTLTSTYTVSGNGTTPSLTAISSVTTVTNTGVAVVYSSSVDPSNAQAYVALGSGSTSKTALSAEL